MSAPSDRNRTCFARLPKPQCLGCAQFFEDVIHLGNGKSGMLPLRVVSSTS